MTSGITGQAPSVYSEENSKGSRLPRKLKQRAKGPASRARGRRAGEPKRHHGQPKGEHKVLTDRRTDGHSVEPNTGLKRHFTPAVPFSGILQMLSVLFSSPHVCLLCLMWNQGI